VRFSLLSVAIFSPGLIFFLFLSFLARLSGYCPEAALEAFAEARFNYGVRFHCLDESAFPRVFPPFLLNPWRSDAEKLTLTSTAEEEGQVFRCVLASL